MRVFFSIVFIVLMTLPVRAENFIPIQEITSEKGIKGWVVQDNTVPVIAISVMFRGGAAYDPDGKSGLANLVSTLMDEGAGDMTAQVFQKKLKDNAIQFSFSAGRDGFYGQIKTVTDNKEIAFDLLSEALNRPRFDADSVTRMKAAIAASLRFDAQDAGWHAQKTLFNHLYQGHAYAHQIKGTEQSLASITREDLRQYHKNTMTQDNLIIGIAGDISLSQARTALDRIFEQLPGTGIRPNVAVTTPQLGSDILYTPWDGPQAVIMMAQKGVSRDDKNWFTAQLLNYILGGGGFSSRLMQEVRVKRGLTYGISTGLIDYHYGPLLLGQANVQPDKINETIDIIKQEWQHMIQHGVTEKELADAKAYLIGSLPLSLTSTHAIANVLVQMQEDNLPINYLDQRSADISRVTQNDLLQFAKLWLNPKHLTFVVAGDKNP